MEDDLAKEIARIEAQLVQDAELRQQQQQQSMQVNTSINTPASLFGFTANGTTTQPQPTSLSQSGGFGVNSAAPSAVPLQQQASSSSSLSFQPPQVAVLPQSVVSGEANMPNVSQTSSANPPPHHFSKDSDGRSIFVGNLPRGENGGISTTPQELASFFADCGQILNCTLLRDRVTHELKGTAYIEFASYSGMGQAIDTKNNADYKGHALIVTRKRSNFKPERARGGRGGALSTGAYRGRGGANGANATNMVTPDPYQAIAALMGMMVGNSLNTTNANNSNFMRGRGGRGGFGRGRGRGRGGVNYNTMNENESAGGGSILGAGMGNNPNGFQPF